jgi:NAD(P)-dependent dehydrogenase (short-subunit alcohol dehydrogenase family)
LPAWSLKLSCYSVLITGPSQGGIGAETVLSLAHGNPRHLILVGRSQARAVPVIDSALQSNPEIKIDFIHVDIASQTSVRQAAAEINRIAEKIDILINNAAIMACPYSKTEDGIESQFATNYLGHFLLTNLLMDKILLAGERARIVNVTSTASRAGGELGIALDDVNFQVSY